MWSRLTALLCSAVTLGGEIANAGIGDLRITEVCPHTGEVEVTHFAKSTILLNANVFFVHREFEGTSFIPAATTFGPNQSKVFVVNLLDPIDSDLWLFSGPDFDNPNNVLGGAKWGPAPNVGKTSVAVAAGKWESTTSFNEAPSPGKCLIALNSNPINPDSWVVGNPSLGSFDLPHIVWVSDVSALEGNSGTTKFVFTISKNLPFSQTTVSYTTDDATAEAGSDYILKTGTVDFPDGSTSTNVVVEVIGETDIELDESFHLRLTDATDGAVFLSNLATGTIKNDDPTPELSVQDIQVTEIDSGAVNAEFKLQLNAPSLLTALVDVRTMDVTASDQMDYSPLAQTVTIPAGESEATVTVQVFGDIANEGDETFELRLSNPVNLIVNDDTAVCTILDDELGSRITIDDVSVQEGDAGVSDAEFTVNLTEANTEDVSVDYAAISDTALVGSDFTQASGTLVIPAGSTSGTIVVPVIGDDIFEQDETFIVQLSNSQNGVIVDNEGEASILNDDQGEGLIAQDASVSEGDSAIGMINFKVILTEPHEGTVTVEYTTADATATDGEDYTMTSGTLTFTPGTTERTISVVVFGDNANETDETLRLQLSNETGTFLLRSEAIGTIVNDDGTAPPRPAVTALSRRSGPAKEEMVIFGRNFSSIPKDNTVRFGAVEATVIAASQTSLTVEPPAGSTYEPITVTVGNLTGEAQHSFTVTFDNNGQIDNDTFGNRADLAAGPAGVDIVAGDFDDDGRADIASLSFGDRKLSLFRNLSINEGVTAGVFANRQDFATELEPVDLIASDVDGDGALDLAVVNAGSGAVSVFLNASSPENIAFNNPVSVPVGINPSSGDLADIDGDGLVDLLVTLGGSAQIAVFRNESSPGTVAFAAGQLFPVGNNPEKILAVELDNDGKMDVIVANGFDGVGGNTIQILRNVSNRGAIDSSSLDVLAPIDTGVNPVDLAAADFDLDGLTDLAVLNRAGGTVSAFRHSNDPEVIAFDAAESFASSLSPSSISVADFNGDGLPDLAVANPETACIRLLQNETVTPGAPLAFSSPTAVHSPGAPNTVFGADLDNNSKPELLVAASGAVSVFNNLMRSIPTLAWGAPGTIVYGEPLAAEHLDATASVPGSFVYDPPAGTILDAGEGQSLRATFVPNDPTDHRIVETFILIDVLPAPLTITPNDAVKQFGEPLPEFTATFEGFVNGDTESDLDSLPTFFTEATAESPVGFYQIIAVGSFDPNYAITHVNPPDRALNIMRAVPTLSWNAPDDIVFGVALGADQLNATSDQAGQFTYAPPIGTILDVGSSQMLSVSFVPFDNFNYEPAEAAVAINVIRARPEIDWENPADITFGDPLGAAELNASSGIPGTFTYTPPAGTRLNAGTAQPLTVSFTPDDSARYVTVTESVAINVLRAGATITWSNPADVVFGTPLSETQLNAVSTVPGELVYNPPLGAILNAGEGRTLSVTLEPDDTANHRPETYMVAINVSKAIPTITWNTPSPIIHGEALSAKQLNATVDFPGALTYSPASGTILDAGDGQTLSVTFTPQSPDNVEGAMDEVTIDVAKADPAVTWNAPQDIVFGTALGAIQLNATANIEGTFVYSPPITTVLNAGGGQALTATFTPADAVNYNPATVETTINVLKANPVIAWPALAPIYFGTPLSSESHLNAETEVSGSFTYTPSAGIVLNAGAGQTLTTTFTPDDTDNYNTVSTTTAIDVDKAVPNITWEDPADMIHPAVLSAIQLNATVDVPGTVAYSPPSGTSLPPGNGHSLRATFTPDDLSNYEITTAQASVNVLRAMPDIEWAKPADIVFGTALGEGQLNAAADVDGAFTYTPDTGAVLNAGADQTLSVTFSPNDPDYSPVTVTVLITVTKAIPEIFWFDPQDIVFGTALTALNQLNALASVEGSFSYTPTEGTILNAGEDQPLMAEFTPTDTDNYENVSAQVAITVPRATPAVTWPSPDGIIFSTPLSSTQLNADAGIPGSYVYDPPAGTILNAGAFQTLSVTFTPDDTANYSPVSAETIIGVAQAIPNITWNNPTDISYGTALSGIQLNPTADAPGSFFFQPSLGTVLNAGENQTLSAVFNPENSGNYTPLIVSISINVLPANLIVRADSKSRGVGAPNPSLTATYLGFVNGDTEESLLAGATLTTTADESSPAGPYDIEASGAFSSNYNIRHRKGTLSVLPNQAPSVILVSPHDGRRSAAGSDVHITAEASDSDGLITKVEFFANGNKIGESTRAPFSALWEDVALGEYTLRAVATDNLNESTTSAGIGLSVIPGVNSANIDPSGSVTLTITGEVGVSYAIQVSDNLTNWTTISTFTASGGPESFPDPDPSTLHAHRFYRIVPTDPHP